MPYKKPLAATLAALLCCVVPLPAQQPQDPTDINYSLSNGAFWNLGIYQPRDIPPADLTDSTRLGHLIRGGKLYLSLADAIALTLENNLDIAVGRYSPLEAAADLLRAKAGSNLSGVQTQISTLSTGQSVQGGGSQFVSGPSGQASRVTQGASQAAQSAVGGGAGNAASFFGTQTINLDPQVTYSHTFFRTSNPQIQSIFTGTNTLINDGRTANWSYQQGFVTGTTVNVGMTTFRQKNNNVFNSFNPTTTADLSGSITQRLTQGFGRAVNARNIRIARNNQEIEDLNFKEQVITTVDQVQRLYWDLVTLRAIAEARRQDIELTEQLLRQTAKQAELGLQARVEVTRAEAEATTFRQQLVDAETNVRVQQEILKNALTKHGPTSATLAGVEIIPTDRIVVAARDAVEPVQDLVNEALSARPSLARMRISLTNSDINLRGIKNALKPALDVTAFATNNGLAGTINENVAMLPGQEDRLPSEFFEGGLGQALTQVFRRNFPDYGVRFNLSIPLKNRTAQADMNRELLRRRRQDIQLRQQENSVKLEVSRAVASLEQARDSYEIARDARELREEMLDAEQKRFELGSSTIFQIIQAQRDLSSARTNEINALNAYKAARMDLEQTTGRTLQANNVSIDEAYNGDVSKAPDPIPPGAASLFEPTIERLSATELLRRRREKAAQLRSEESEPAAAVAFTSGRGDARAPTGPVPPFENPAEPAPEPAAAQASTDPESAAPGGLEAAEPAVEADAGGYHLQVAALRRRQEAYRLAGRLQGMGHPAGVRSGDDLIRVIVGPFSDREAAEGYRGRLESDGFVALLKRF